MRKALHVIARNEVTKQSRVLLRFACLPAGRARNDNKKRPAPEWWGRECYGGEESGGSIFLTTRSAARSIALLSPMIKLPNITTANTETPSATKNHHPHGWNMSRMVITTIPSALKTASTAKERRQWAKMFVTFGCRAQVIFLNHRSKRFSSMRFSLREPLF
ncbi:MAG: hypothetical protein G01um101438_408 [Parcubacteria group bacterium Gr01-1014_38]|nr:MAG: hypothetical protein G01um101438_408 [Parcubacteria group bacterium Gr01-1014_38]